ncbi:DUF1995 family protein [Coleofasciculus sp. FACHB-T130]|uniref:DUF1995 family protein n=1 Tax=Cyanophyceae TaxID=3028117 RepID=UPI001689C552|nr:DUF1995 family protein [Coleofasciculus sp. FACHB-T130]MBD1882022.1 DUF1995 family protein [Coleofasciculus sp. FACHB-T130]
MAELPKSLEEAIAQSREATQAAIANGYTRIKVELVFPELKPMPVALQFIEAFEEMASELKVFFPDAGAAALARRDWGQVPFKITDIGSSRASVDEKIHPEDRVFLFVEPSAVEVLQVEKLCEAAGDRPVVLLNPNLEDAAIIGIGYAGRQLRDRFLTTLESSYYLRPLDGAAVLRCYPSPWQVWQETKDNYQLIAEVSTKPVGEELDNILAGTTQAKDAANPSNRSSETPAPKKPGLFTNLQRFIRTLSR